MSDEQVYTIKRDGRKVLFDRCRISDAILRASKDVQELDASIAYELTDEICTRLFHKGHREFAVEEIQDEVVEVLTLRYPKIATAYAIYRQKRTDARELKSVENQVISDIVMQDAAENDSKRENANIDGNSVMGAMLKIGGTAAKEFNLRNLIKPKHAKMHRDGLLHLHDLDFMALTVNCMQIPLGKLLRNGFNTGHGSLRPPATIGSAATLMCIIIQSCQNDFYGGQAIPTVDYDLAPYVAKSYVRNLAEYLEVKYELDHKKLKEQFVSILDDYIYVHGHVINDQGYAKITEVLDAVIGSTINYHQTESEMFDYTFKKTDRDTFQAMEATVHNLCTLQSRCGAQPPFSSLNFGTDTSEEGRIVTKNLLLATEKGLGAGETAIFPISIFKMKKGINDKGSKNYDLFKLACRVSALRLFPKQN